MYSNKEIINLIDLTLLDEKGGFDAVKALSQKANALSTKVASICIYPKFIEKARQELNKEIKIATVVNFPLGNDSKEKVMELTKEALNAGADEIDMVIPYKNYLKMDQNKIHADEISIELVKALKAICGKKILKVIIESGELKDEKLIAQASIDAVIAGADFIKTSTGKTKNGASIKAAKIMLNTIKLLNKKGLTCGFKASGGVRTKTQAEEYLNLAKDILGEKFIDQKTFRFGASGLLDTLLTGEENQSSY